MKKYANDSFYKKNNFLITGGAGFIGSNIVKHLVENDAKLVRVFDNLETGDKHNIEQFLSLPNVEFVQGDITDMEMVNDAIKEINYISHQAALGSVPRSIKDPVKSNNTNITGSLNILSAVSRNKKDFKRMVYAGSSSTYGDSKSLPKEEEIIGNPLSPYAVTKYTNELYAENFCNIHKMTIVGLRYFNVFGPNQSPNNPYAAVIPLFINAALNNKQPLINGDGSTSRDFTFVENVVQANIKSLVNKNILGHEVFNISCGKQTNLNELWSLICKLTKKEIEPIYGPERIGDVKHSLASIKKAEGILEYSPSIFLEEGLKITLSKYFGYQ